MSSDLHTAWSTLFVESLASAGVTTAVISPGSRSTPLALAFARSRMTSHVIVDERAAAFFALGHARVTRRPAVLLCTSGTAPAHYLPAVIEAHQSGTPLVVISADRPWDLADCGAPQTIDQRKLFGSFVRHDAELGVPEVAALRAVPRIAAQLVHRSLGPKPGPVHLNARFRKPLEPQTGERASWMTLVDELIARGAPLASSGAVRAEDATIEAIAARCARAERGVIVAGPSARQAPTYRASVAKLVATTGFAVLAEATSQLRFGALEATRIGSFDALFRSPRVRSQLGPDLVLQLGAPPTSGALAAFFDERPELARVVIDPLGWSDPSSTAAMIVEADIEDVAVRVAAKLEARGEATYARALAEVDAAASDAATRLSRGEGFAARALVRALPDGATLMVGNSLSVRDLDAFAAPSSKLIDVLHQRGASGIDGLVAAIAGARDAATGAVALLLGDVSLRHDIASLELCAGKPIVVVVVNNDGGRIFDRLPIGKNEAAAPNYERLFLTKSALSFERAAAAFGVAHVRVETERELDEALVRALASSDSTLVEVSVSPSAGADEAKQIQAAIEAHLSSRSERDRVRNES